MVKHIVTFRLIGSAEQRLSVARQFKAALEALPAQIPELLAIEVGINANPAEQWDVVLTATLAEMSHVAVYAAHPAHVAAAGLLAGHKADRACVDYEV